MAKSRTSDRITRKEPGTDTIHRRRAKQAAKSVFKGLPVVPGIAIGTVKLKFRQNQVLSDRKITPEEVSREHDRLMEAVGCPRSNSWSTGPRSPRRSVKSKP
jgi:hypothetical protein